MKIVPLGELCIFGSGGTPSRSEPRFFEGTTPWITGADIGERNRITPRSFISDEAIRGSAVSVAPVGTLLLVTRTAVGKVAIADRAMGFSQDITSLSANRSKIHPEYLAAYLANYAPTLAGQARGATILGVTRAQVQRIGIPLPSLPEQRRIASILDRADALRARQGQMVDSLDCLSDSVFFDLFGDVVSNSRQFRLLMFREVGALERGVSRVRPRNRPDLLGGGHPLIQTGEVANSNGYVRQHVQTYSDAGLAQSKMWPAGTLAITIAANIAKTGILMFPACFPDSVVGFTPNRAIVEVEYVRFWLRSLQATLERQAPMSAQKNINLAILRKLQIPVPSISSQRTFAVLMGGIELKRQLEKTRIVKLDELFASLQHRAFRGEL